MVSINLLSDIVLERRRDAKVRKLAAAGLGAWLILLVVAVLLVVLYRQAELIATDVSQKSYTSLNSQVNSSDMVQKRGEALEVQTSLKAVQTLVSNQNKMSAMLARLGELMPKGASMQDVTLGEDGKVSLTGKAGSYAQVGELLASLKKSADTATAPAATIGNQNTDGSQIVTKGSFTDPVLQGANQSDRGIAFTVSTSYVPGSNQ